MTLHSYGAVCQCQPEITNIFTNITQYVTVDNIMPTIGSIDSALIPQIKNNKEAIDKQNKTLEKELKLEQAKYIETQRLIFQLEKIIKLKELKQ
jgi:hypothetical protein